jgi:hypothetical protein
MNFQSWLVARAFPVVPRLLMGLQSCAFLFFYWRLVWGEIWEWSFSLRLCLVEVGSEKVCPNITRKPKSKIMTPKAHKSSRKDTRRPLCAIRTVSVSRARCFLCQRTRAWSYIYGEERRREEGEDGKTGRRRRAIYRKERLGGQMSQLAGSLAPPGLC